MATLVTPARSPFLNIEEEMQILGDFAKHNSDVLSINLVGLAEKVHVQVRETLSSVGLSKFYTLRLLSCSSSREELVRRYQLLSKDSNVVREKVRVLMEEIIPLFKAVEARVVTSIQITSAAIRKAKVLLESSQAKSVTDCVERVRERMPRILGFSSQLCVLSVVAKDRLDDLDRRLDDVDRLINPTLSANIPGIRLVQKVGRAFFPSSSFIPRILQDVGAEGLEKQIPRASLEEIERRFAALCDQKVDRKPGSRLVLEMHTLLIEANAALLEIGGESGSHLEKDLGVIGSCINGYHYIQELCSNKAIAYDSEEFAVWEEEKEQLIASAERARAKLERLIEIFDEGITFINVGDFSEADKQALKLLCVETSASDISRNQEQIQELRHLLECYRSLLALYEARKQHSDEMGLRLVELKKGLEPKPY